MVASIAKGTTTEEKGREIDWGFQALYMVTPMVLSAREGEMTRDWKESSGFEPENDI
jgi:hypothetical protein